MVNLSSDGYNPRDNYLQTVLAERDNPAEQITE